MVEAVGYEAPSLTVGHSRDLMHEEVCTKGHKTDVGAFTQG
jgi:hypothetical protein